MNAKALVMAKFFLRGDFFEEQEILCSTDFCSTGNERRHAERLRGQQQKAIERIARKRPQDEVETVESTSAITARSKCDRHAAH
jgi:hypothetical protein